MKFEFEWINRPCPLCGAARIKRVFAESNIDAAQLTEFAFASRKLPEYCHPRLVECQNCNLMYGDPVLSPNSLAKLYREAAFDGQHESQLASVTYKQLVERYLKQLPDRVGTIDIGAGDGTFCERLVELGFTAVVGMEPSAAPVAAAKPEVRALLRQAMFNADDFAPNSVSLISSFQVMEHVSAPRHIVNSAFRVLKAGGLFLAVVHNQRALPTRILGLKSPIYDIEHLQLFARPTARRLLEDAGFERVEVYPLWNRYPVRYWMRLFPFPSGLKNRLLSLAEASRVGGIQISMPAGNLVLSGFKP